MDELRLKLLQSGFGLLPLGQIPDKPSKKTIVSGLHLTHRELHRKSGSILALADDHAADPDDPAFACGLVALQISVMIFAVRRWHQDLDVLAQRLCALVSEQSLGCAAERLHDAVFIDDDHRFRNGVKNGLEMRFARERITGHKGRAPSASVENFAAPGDADADKCKSGAVNQSQF